MSRVLFNSITKKQWEQHEDTTVSYVDLKAFIEEYCKENIAYQDQTDQLVAVSMSSLDKSSSSISDLYKGLNVITELLKDISNAVKDDPATNKKIDEAIKTFAKISTQTTEILSLVKTFDFSTLQSTIIDKGKGIATESDEDTSKRLVLASTIIHPDPDEPVRKATEEAKLLAMSRPEVINLDAEHEVLKREHSKNVKRLTKLHRKRDEEYTWTMTNKIKPEPITDVKIHPNTKPIVASVFRNNDKRNVDAYQPFKFSDFGITELDELGPIIQKKKNSIVKDLMTSLSKRYERLKKILEELGIQSDLPTLVPEQASSQTSGRKRKHMELEPKVQVPGLECNRSLREGVPFINNMVIEEPEYRIFFTDVFSDQEFQRWDDIYKVGMDSLVSYVVMASMVKTEENVRFSMKLRKLIADHPDQDKLKSKKVKLEALGYHVE
ncbi:hypothetical protein Tco_1029332 [Tanacetum coccineum]|uniref:Phosphoprotein n=1 Tax=Tanacetum coccineum TaxID=301880 RepID=A0ABQ5G3G6_9ASTR